MTSQPLPDFQPPLRPELAGLTPYVPGEQPADPRTIKLNTNEFPYPSPAEVIDAVRRETGDRLRVYPDPNASALRRELAAMHGVDGDRIVVGNGSDEILRLILHAFGGPGRSMAIVDPSYSLYPILARQFDTPVKVHALDNATALPDSLFADATSAICMLAVPNPPLGTSWAVESLERLAAKRWLLALDGAYVDFAGEDDARGLTESFANVILTRTFSKSFGLAGMRVGYAIASPRLIDGLLRVRDSYPVNRLSQAAALGALAGREYYRVKCAEIVATRDRVAGELRGLGFDVADSRGNFLFARRSDAVEVYELLKESGILVRYFNLPGLRDGLRITIGTPEEMERLLIGLA